MPTGIRRFGACGRSEWVATILATVEFSRPSECACFGVATRSEQLIYRPAVNAEFGAIIQHFALDLIEVFVSVVLLPSVIAVHGIRMTIVHAIDNDVVDFAFEHRRPP